MGNIKRPFRVVKYQSEWAKTYQREKNVISRVFGKDALRIEHIGSTSVPGIWAKPQVDILVLVHDLKRVAKYIKGLTAKGYTYRPNYIDHLTEEYFTKDAPSGERLVSLHIKLKDDQSALSNVYFRDYLRLHPKDRDKYSKAKLLSYREHKNDPMSYHTGKKKVLGALVKKAQKWYESA